MTNALEQLSKEGVTQRCSTCDTKTVWPAARLSIGVTANAADDVDGRVVRLPPCPTCKAEEFLVRAAEETKAMPEHRLLVNELHAQLAKAGQIDKRVVLQDGVNSVGWERPAKIDIKRGSST